MAFTIPASLPHKKCIEYHEICLHTAEQTKICARHTTNLKAIIIATGIASNTQNNNRGSIDTRDKCTSLEVVPSSSLRLNAPPLLSLKLRNKDENANLITPLPVFVFARTASNSAAQITPFAGAYL